MNQTVCIIGPGRVGGTLFRELAETGQFSMLQPVPHEQATQGNFPHAAIYCITTPDSCIAQTAQRLVASSQFSLDASVLHCSGVLGSTILVEQGIVHAASFHPARSMTALEGTFRGATVTVEGEAVAVKNAAGIADALGARTAVISLEKKALYHAATVFASNFVPALLSVAEELLCDSGLQRASAQTIAIDLASSALSNVQSRGLAGGLTGPLVRGDAQTIACHVAALAQHPEFLEIYVKLTNQLQKIIADSADPGSSRGN